MSKTENEKRTLTEEEMWEYLERKRRLVAKKRREERGRRILSLVGILLLLGALALFLWLLMTYVQSQQALREQEQMMSSWQQGQTAVVQSTPALSESTETVTDETTETAETTVPADAATDAPDEADVEPTAEPTAEATEDTTDAAVEDAEEETAEETVEETVQEPVVSQGFDALLDLNPDMIGWLDVSTVISTPVVQRDNSYYRDRDFYGNHSAGGTVFADELNEDWLSDSYLIFYGYNQETDGTFARIEQYQTVDYLKEHSYVKFQAAYNDQVWEYVPFAVVNASVDSEAEDYFFLRRFDIFQGETRDEAAIGEFLTEVKSRSLFQIPVEVDAQDQILCLVTYSQDASDARCMVFFRQVREDENVEQMRIDIWSNVG